MPKVCLIAGVGINDSNGDVKNNPHYIKWDSMLGRCYRKSNSKHLLNYGDCSVCESWIRFTNFEIWSEENYHPGYHLDKDILVKGNREYGPKVCAYIPPLVNNILGSHANARGEYPLGVSRMSKDKRMVSERAKPFIAKMTDNGKTVNMGYFSSPQEAHRKWQLAKAAQLESVIAWYATQPKFRTDVAEALTQRVWQLRLDHSFGIETKEL